MQGSKLYVGNLSYSVSIDELKGLYSPLREVRDAERAVLEDTNRAQ
ncbi:hypothetical protein [Syntrophorhabdus aromaticivorans]|uniref:RNA-binding protein n=1 Tax=Syntrophorhabdus aromaticivorans TaxID=328301 RepID=A0A971M5Y5_9BACT|nr:hypothetical protein [Syntrophorhabdus aromaticivorans]NLW35889.1 hypothetical protein [Syntrophorhabdus aromaticivorans]